MTRRIWAGIAFITVSATALSTAVDLPSVLLWNASSSVSMGLYRLQSVDHLGPRDLVAVAAPDQIAAFIAERGYLPPDIPLLKHVAGLPGQIVCRLGRSISVDGVSLGQAQHTDSRARPMPVWQGCHRITSDEVFLMNPEAENSLDGRYFGPISRNALLAEAIPIWTADAHAKQQPSASDVIGNALISITSTP
ncbi:S26 family signal peptidase [Roseovarius sp. LXJ103]|uniref:S26 family signal peptidase n=1 Tax=Roseovarius carneus TaxID=2853164 RepID=UPI000D61EE2B|nr:S26 family signal peptidase [Roseovarius carneus]MBZ8119832.1 S26 family signal peptidase [Roseovarius carneus]PWE34574.1 S26 family signal peptidase [Pelagicola sp. LXJ1103]